VHVHTTGGESKGLALGSLCVILGIFFILDFLFAIKNTRFTYVQTKCVV
jgi:hypothetical protein